MQKIYKSITTKFEHAVDYRVMSMSIVIFVMSSSGKVTLGKHILVGIWGSVGILLLLLLNKPWLAKKRIKNFSFLLKSMINLF